MTDAELRVSEAELVNRFFESAFAADLGFHRLEHAFYRISAEIRRTSHGQMCPHETPSLGTSVTRSRLLNRLTPLSYLRAVTPFECARVELMELGWISRSPS